MTDDADAPKIIETESCTIFLLNGQYVQVLIPKGGWFNWVLRVKADNAIITEGIAIPLTSVAAIARGPAMPQQPIDVSARGRLN